MSQKKLSQSSGRRKGAQPGNGNARKTGAHTAQMRAFRARVRACLKRAAALTALAEALAATRTVRHAGHERRRSTTSRI